MKINPDYKLRSIAGENIIVPTGKASKELNGMINLNETGAIIFKGLTQGKSREEIVQQIMDEFEVEKEVADKDVQGFMDMLKGVGMLIEE